MTHIPVGKKLPVTEYVPLPKNRPEVLKTEEMPPVQDLQSSIHPTMPLGSPEKPADALFQGGGYHPSSLDQIDLLSLPRASEYKLYGTDLFRYYFNNIGDEMMEVYNAVGERWFEIIAFAGVLSAVGVVAVFAILGIEWLVKKILGYKQ